MCVFHRGSACVK